mmetsp:Transcript_7320/g.17895  ORF Transcript_7320/g.17895 Transcript_7320/m.17895 type:complete len:295 (+) Transcript_7320:175-1059(+)
MGAKASNLRRSMSKGAKSGNDEALMRMQLDEDILQEAAAIDAAKRGVQGSTAAAPPSAPPGGPHVEHVPLNWKRGQGGHKPNDATRRMLHEAGGRDGVAKFTNLFYQIAFQDPHIDQFIRDHDDPHGDRFADWITEKFGVGTPWSTERSTRKTCPFHAHGHKFESAHDRSSAHFTAWHSPKRSEENFGEHFKLDDCRVWMRLHFWALRETGVWAQSPSFAEYYLKFIGHFVSIYERTATLFVRESARWSENPANCEKYLANGRRMDNVLGLSLREACKALPDHERDSVGDWPYC